MTYKSYFDDSQKQIDDYTQNVRERYGPQYEILNELFGYQYYVRKKFLEYYKGNFEKNSLIFTFFSYNVDSLLSALKLVESDMLYPSTNNLRAVCESIPKMYYVSQFPDEISDILIHQVTHMEKFDNIDSILKNYEKIKYNKSIFENGSKFDKFTKRYTANGIRKKLYYNNRLNNIQILYRTFSENIHSNIKIISRSSDKLVITIESVFEILQSFSYFNIISFLDGNYDTFDSKFKKESLNFLAIMNNKIQFVFNNVNFIPNTDSIMKLNISLNDATISFTDI